MNLSWKKNRRNEGSGISLLNWEKPDEPTLKHLITFFYLYFSDDPVEGVTEEELQKIGGILKEYDESMAISDLQSLADETVDWYNRSHPDERKQIVIDMMTPLEDMEDAAKDKFLCGLAGIAMLDGEYDGDETLLISWVCKKWGWLDWVPPEDREG